MKFVQVFEMHKQQIFGDAVHQLNKNGQVKLRKPNMLSDEEDVSNLRDYTVNRIKEMSSE